MKIPNFKNCAGTLPAVAYTQKVVAIWFKGISRDHKLLILASNNERGPISAVASNNRIEELSSTTNFRLIHPTSIKYWIQNFNSLKTTWLKKVNQTDPTVET